MLPDLDDDATPLPTTLPNWPDTANLPLEIFTMKQALAQHAQVLNALHAERRETRKGFRNMWFALLGVAVTIAVTAGGALLQMGAYMERIDNVSASQERIERRIDTPRH